MAVIGAKAGATAVAIWLGWLFVAATETLALVEIETGRARP